MQIRWLTTAEAEKVLYAAAVDRFYVNVRFGHKLQRAKTALLSNQLTDITLGGKCARRKKGCGKQKSDCK